MKIFGLGLSRTGTHSLSAALERLGYTSKHYPHLSRVMAEAELYDSLTDTPVIPYMEALDVKYPDAKFILTVRDPKDWIISVELHWKLAKANALSTKKNRILVYGRVDWDKDDFMRVYKKHVAKVRAYFKDRQDKLLVMNIRQGDGYNKLCPFLGLPVLDEPFPYESVRRPCQ